MVFLMTLIIIVGLILIWGWRLVNWIWLKPKKLERLLREQGLQGNPYRFFVGDMKDMLKMRKEAKSKPMNLSDDIGPRVFSYAHQSVAKHGILCLYLFGFIPLYYTHLTLITMMMITFFFHWNYYDC